MIKDGDADHFSESVLITSREVAAEMLGLTEEYETAEGLVGFLVTVQYRMRRFSRANGGV